MSHRLVRAAAALAAVLTLTTAIPTPGWASPAALRILVVGDSISQGCLAAPQAGWCAPLGQHLTAAGTAVTWAYHVHPGWSCGQLGTDLAAQVTAAAPDLVVVQCGTNDGVAAATVRDRYTAIIDTIRSRSDAVILAGWVQYSDPEIQRKAGRSWLVGDLGEGGTEGQANDGIYQALASRGAWTSPPASDLVWYDLQRIPGTRTYLLGGSDGIHPNQLGDATIAAILWRAVRARLGLPDTVPEPCGLYGHRTVYGPPPYEPCTEAS